MPPAAQTSFRVLQGVFRCRSATCGLSAGFFELFHYRCSFLREHQRLAWRYASFPTGTNAARTIGLSTRQCSYPFQGHQQSYMSTAAMPPAAQTSFKVLLGGFSLPQCHLRPERRFPRALSLPLFVPSRASVLCMEIRLPSDGSTNDEGRSLFGC